MDRSAYQLVTRSECWNLRRDEYMRGKTYCECCGAPGSLQAHHLTYERIGRELDEDLVAVCDQCHRTLHGLKYTSGWATILRATFRKRLECLASNKGCKILAILDEMHPELEKTA